MDAQPDCFEAITATLKKTAAALERRGVPFLLGGSLAGWARGGPETCNDLDFMIRERDAERALEALEEAGLRTERPPEQWLVKAWDGDVLVDLIHHPIGVPIDDATFERAEELSAAGVEMKAMALEDVIVTKLLALEEHSLDYEGTLQLVRPLRERIDWNDVRARTSDSPFAKAFFTLVEELGLVAPAEKTERRREPRVRLA